MGTPTPTATSTIPATPTPTPTVSPSTSITPTVPLSDPPIYVGGANVVLRKISPAGKIDWTLLLPDHTITTPTPTPSNTQTPLPTPSLTPTPTPVYLPPPTAVKAKTSITGMEIGADGTVYSVAANHTVWKFVDFEFDFNDPNTSVWPKTFDSDITSFAINRNGEMAIGTFSGVLRKLDQNAVELWNYVVGTFVQALAFDTELNIYFGADDYSVRKLSPSGNEIWRNADHTGEVTNIATDHLLNVYSASRDNTFKKIKSNGSQLWSYDSLFDINSTAVDGKLYSYIVDSNGTVTKLNRSGNIVWEVRVTNRPLTDVSVDVNFNVYVCSVDGTIAKLSQNGSIIWSLKEPRTSFNTIVSSPLLGSVPELWGKLPVPTPTPTQTPTITPTNTTTPTITPSPSV